MEFVDLKHQYRLYRDEILSELEAVMASAQFIKGPAVTELETALALHTGVKHAIGCSSGTDALLLGLLALGVGPGDEVIVPDFTFIATAEVVSLIGAIPIFADISEDTCNIDPDDLERRITPRTKGIIPVSLYGQCPEMDEIDAIAGKNGLWVMEDGAQSYGATYRGRKSCALSQVGTTSFFPAKPLGAYGDGGAVFTDDDATADRIRMLLNHGQEKRYHHAIVGLNARLDTMQAAVLKVKLRHFDEEVVQRQRVASRYTKGLRGSVTTPVVLRHNTSVWAQYTVRTAKRDQVIAALKERGIPTAIHYPMPLHSQKAFASLGSAHASYPLSEAASREVFSLPMHPFLTDEQIDTISEAVRASVDGR